MDGSSTSDVLPAAAVVDIAANTTVAVDVDGAPVISGVLVDIQSVETLIGNGGVSVGSGDNTGYTLIGNDSGTAAGSVANLANHSVSDIEALLTATTGVVTVEMRGDTTSAYTGMSWTTADVPTPQLKDIWSQN